MDGRSYTLIIGLLLAASALTGCIQNPDWLNTASTEVSAQENAGVAKDAALAWNEGAVLVGIMAFELSDSPDPRIDADPDPGNGLAPAWWYVYCATTVSETSSETPTGDAGGEASASTMSSMVRAFKVTADGTVSSEKDAEAFAAGMDHGAAEAIGEWTVDSDEALATAKGDESFAKVAQGYNATVVEGVAHYEGATTWWVSAMSADGFVVATIDAVTGELLAVTPMDLDFEMPAFEWGAANPELLGEPVYLEGEGIATPGAEPTEFAFSKGATPMSGTLVIYWQESAPVSAPGEGIWWAIVDADGETYDRGSTNGFMFGSAGEYEVDVNLDDVEARDLSLVIGYGSWTPIASPLSEGSPYTFTLDLYPPGMEPVEDEEDDG